MECKVNMYLGQKEQGANRDVLLYATTKKTLIYACLASVWARVPYLFHAHSFENANKPRFRFKKVLYTRARNIIAVSHFVKSGLNLPNTEVVFNPIEIPAEAIKPKNIQDKKQFVVAAFAGLIPQKGLEYLMQSYAYLPASLKDKLEIRIYGEGFYRNYLQQFTQSNVLLLGFCEDIDRVYQHEIDLTVVPSVILESFGMATIESFKYGIPVICTNQGGPAEIVSDGQNGFHVPIKDPKAIAEKISQLLLNPDLYQAFSINALEHSKNFDIQLFIQKISKIFREAF